MSVIRLSTPNDYIHLQPMMQLSAMRLSKLGEVINRVGTPPTRHQHPMGGHRVSRAKQGGTRGKRNGRPWPHHV